MFTIQLQNEKSMIFSEKNFFGTFLIFFPKGGPLEAIILKNNFFNFSKIFKTKPKNDFHGTIQT